MKSDLPRYQHRFESYAKQHLPHNKQHIGKVYEALHYSFFAAGSKRLRPLLVYAMADSLGIASEQVDDLALAIECIHTYSLIHDDLPAMDDDDLRRGQPACHKQFNEATAILAGDALNTFAFEHLAQTDLQKNSNKKLQQIQLLAGCAGIAGMVGGQDTDLNCEKQKYQADLPILTQLYQQKTAKLFEACLLGGYLLSDCYDTQKAKHLSQAALSLGLLYQIQDDILDVTQSSEVLGKPSGSDHTQGKATYVSLLGLSDAKQAAKVATDTIYQQLSLFFSPKPLITNSTLEQLIKLISKRNR